MTSVPFTQYMMPHGMPQDVTVDIAPEIATKAMAIIARGLRFECEVLTTGEVSFTITDPEEGDLEIEVVPNGPGVVEAIETMIERFWRIDE